MYNIDGSCLVEETNIICRGGMDTGGASGAGMDSQYDHDTSTTC